MELGTIVSLSLLSTMGITVSITRRILKKRRLARVRLRTYTLNK